MRLGWYKFEKWNFVEKERLLKAGNIINVKKIKRKVRGKM